MVASAARRGVELRIGHIWLQPLSAVTLDDVELRDPVTGGTIAKIRRISVRFDLHGVSNPKVFLQEVAVTEPRLRLHRAKDGRLNVDGLLRSLRGTNTGKKGEIGGLRQYLSRHVPKVSVAGMQLRIDDDKGSPLKTPSGVDLRHLHLRHASFELEDTSPVQETIALTWSARTQIEGIAGAVGARGTVKLPDRTGDLHVALPAGFALQAGGIRAGIEGLSLTSDGQLDVTGIRISKERGSQRLSLVVKRVSTKLSMNPIAEDKIPARIRSRLPSAALLALRHVRRVELHRPVVIGTRPSTDDDQHDAGPDKGTKADAKSAKNRRKTKARALLPKATRRTDTDGKDSGKRSRKQRRKALAKHKPNKRGSHKTANKPAPGQIVREGLRKLLSSASERMEAQLGRLHSTLSALPIDEIKVTHGSARFRGERSATGLAREVSDYNLTVVHKGDAVTLALDFSVPGKKGTQRIEGRVDTKSGDMHLNVRLDQLPLAPYAAILPTNVYVHGNSSLHDTRFQVVVNAKDRTISVDGEAALSHLDVRARRISRHLLSDLSLRGKGRLVLDLGREMVRLTNGEASVGKVTALIDGSVLRYRSAPAFDLHVKMPTVRCQDIVDALVPNVAPMLKGMSCRGTASLRLNLGLDTKDMRSLKLEYKPLLRKIEIDSLGKYIRFDVLQAPFEHHARQRDDSLYTFVTGPGSDRWAPLEGMSENMVKVVTTTEDGSFFWHKGFSLNQIRSAFVANLQKGRFVRGASTISQQVVKNLFFVEREKTLARKLQEAIITWEMERQLEKNQILELYFNIIEFGPKIYGIRAAASHYFNRPPLELTLLQTIWLGSIIPNPKAFYHQFTKGKVKPSWQKYLCWIGGVMLKREKITAAEKARLGSCEVVFGSGADGSEVPEQAGLGHEGALGDDAPLPPPGGKPPVAPSVPDDEQP
ncbi:MAG: transglycosylase domain-containing protein [Myxococcales bacterium]|nr:transglycosylase domain-containing protein [Myxococcales bacterium]